VNDRDDSGVLAVRLQAFLRALRERYERVQQQGAAAGVDPATLEGCLSSLTLAEAAVRYLDLGADPAASRPLQVAVLGPTQTGKSTIVNLILGMPAAVVSPLAGFTVHAQGFCVDGAASDGEWTRQLFPGGTRRTSQELRRDELDAYALSQVAQDADAQARPPTLPPCTIWDTPDFDSLAARRYQRGVLETAALADAHLLVLSKEKYSDLAAWNLLALHEPLGRPMLICLNKLTPDAFEAIPQSLRARLAERCPTLIDAPIVGIPYRASGQLAAADVPGEVAQLRAWVANLHIAPRAKVSGVQKLIRRHWDDWTAPLCAEHEALQAWQALVSAALQEMLDAYRRDFLDHPQRFDSFRRATVGLLALLELPGAAGVIGRVREAVTYPVRRLLAGGRSWLERRRDPSAVRRRTLAGEERVLFDLIDELLVRLERDVARRCDAQQPGCAVWRALGCRLEQQGDALRERLQAAARRHHESFAREIQAAANRLYEALRQNPALLNTLRAARATADVAALALAIKTGGTPIHELLFAPAMLALSSLLTEGALGAYLRSVESELKQRQLEQARAGLFQGEFARSLRELVAGLEGAGVLGVPPEALAQAAADLAAWERQGSAAVEPAA